MLKELPGLISRLRSSVALKLHQQSVPVEKLNAIKAVVFDVDGIMTDCKIWLDSSGEWRRAFTVRDGVGIKRLLRAGYRVGWITGTSSEDIRVRSKLLGIDFLAEGKETKEASFEEFLTKFDLRAEEVAYIGDDLPDVPLLLAAGFSATVPAAVDEVLEVADYLTWTAGGEGAARELCELVMKHGSLTK